MFNVYRKSIVIILDIKLRQSIKQSLRKTSLIYRFMLKIMPEFGVLFYV